jgi:hypothetical protein
MKRKMEEEMERGKGEPKIKDRSGKNGRNNIKKYVVVLSSAKVNLNTTFDVK